MVHCNNFYSCGNLLLFWNNLFWYSEISLWGAVFLWGQIFPCSFIHRIKPCSCHSVIPRRIAVVESVSHFWREGGIEYPNWILLRWALFSSSSSYWQDQCFSVLQRKELKNLSCSPWVIMRVSAVARRTCIPTVLCSVWWMGETNNVSEGLSKYLRAACCLWFYSVLPSETGKRSNVELRSLSLQQLFFWNWCL